MIFRLSPDLDGFYQNLHTLRFAVGSSDGLTSLTLFPNVRTLTLEALRLSPNNCFDMDCLNDTYPNLNSLTLNNLVPLFGDGNESTCGGHLFPKLNSFRLTDRKVSVSTVFKICERLPVTLRVLELGIHATHEVVEFVCEKFQNLETVALLPHFAQVQLCGDPRPAFSFPLVLSIAFCMFFFSLFFYI